MSQPDTATAGMRYAAFISYRHQPADRAIATRLMHALERYRVPRELVKKGYPARLGKVFRDDDEMPAAGNLPGQIEAALAASQVQVVICSRATPHSQWVRREIQHFQQLVKGHAIFPVMIEGEPDESFPPELLYRDIGYCIAVMKLIVIILITRCNEYNGYISRNIFLIM
ncbi:MAG: hypothetical protein Tsb0027_11160 [Wenzhouxiangellaceae bacterium]